MSLPHAATIFLGDTAQQPQAVMATGGYVTLLGEPFYQIRHYDALEPFFISLVSSSNHWLFIASTGGLTAGRVNADQALFPYYTEDKLTENSDNTGHKAILLVQREGRTSLWEPFSPRYPGVYKLERHLYKNVPGTALVFEEINHTLGLTYRYAWRTSPAYGFVKTAWLVNPSAAPCTVSLLDGLQNILPANVTASTQVNLSPLLDAYKRHEVQTDTGLGIFALNATLTDLAEPSESLLATTVFQLGLPASAYLLSAAQLDAFRRGQGVTTETEIRGQRGAYLVHATLMLAPGAEHSWHFVAEVMQDSAAIVALTCQLRTDPQGLAQAIQADLAANTTQLQKIVASADGLQVSQEPLRTANHFANAMFNVMRGGVFVHHYELAHADFVEFVATRQPGLLTQHADFFAALPANFTLQHLLTQAQATGHPDLRRLSYGYLPLTFSRRHGDPSRPWNRFTINLKKPDGTQKLDYEGNWRDIFQNWEALALSYPEFIESMIATFLNATTADGYNPYRITRAGIDWEIPEPHNPWANIGYWSDHQIIYLQKLMEISAQVHPGQLTQWLGQAMFSYAQVPYRIKPYADLLVDPYHTIDFDWDLERAIEAEVARFGTDAKLLRSADGRVCHVTLTEKLLTLLLAKLFNFVPEGGIWMNTQRPEWNDANNALVGKGLSVVTLGYLRRFLLFCQELFTASPTSTVAVSPVVANAVQKVVEVLCRFAPTGPYTPETRRAMMDALSEIGSAYRAEIYHAGLTGDPVTLTLADLNDFMGLARTHVEHALRANRRADHLYHAYNILHLSAGRAVITYLSEMLEGQVAVLSSGLLSGEEALALLRSLRHSALYRADQHSYILYPDRVLPGFLEKNTLAPHQLHGLRLPQALVQAGDTTVLVRDVAGQFHFSGQLRHQHDLARALAQLKRQPAYADLVAAEASAIEALFEQTFRHAEFTGRSGTFFAYEGLGSIYWHMVSKLLLAVQETLWNARHEACYADLRACYLDLCAGQIFNKPPAVYGAFPTDPYSHTPKGRGAKQPGMTGLVKEELLIRQRELGWAIEAGQLVFDALLLDRAELLTTPTDWVYWDVRGQQRRLTVPAQALAYTICQVPVVVQASQGPSCVRVYLADGSAVQVLGLRLSVEHSQHIFQRDGIIEKLVVTCPLTA